MSNNQRVYNVTRGFTLKHKQAVRAVEECSAEWVEFGISIRDLSLAECIAKRALQEKSREPLAKSELPNLHFRSPKGQEAQTSNEYSLAIEANQWARLQSA